MGDVVAILRCDVPVVDHEHVAVKRGDGFFPGTEEVEGAVDDFIGRYDLVIVSRDIMEIETAFLLAPSEMAQAISDIVDFFAHDVERHPVKILTEGGKVNVGGKYWLHAHDSLKGFLGIELSGLFHFET